jgi:hypothetical protein
MKSISATASLASASELVPRPRDVAFDYLKATVILMVVAHHSCLAYTTFAHFDPADYLKSTAPVVDTARGAPAGGGTPRPVAGQRPDRR